VYNNSSSWLNHVNFFMTFIFANALTIFNLPAPSLQSSSNAEQDKSRQEKLDARVNNRKWLSGGIMATIAFLFVIILLFRFLRTPCEAGFFRSILPIILTSSLGYSWFRLVYEKCGVRPADVLGIVQGLISPELIDNPIVCLGS
jgi:hypothetical protein